MITNDQLLKLFVLVPSTVTNFDGAKVSGAANEHRLFFEESTGLIWAKGQSFGGNDSELEAIVNGLIGEDTNKSIREIAGAVLSEAMNLADDANTTIDNLTEVLKWFKDLPEEEEGALNLIARLGKPEELYTAEDESANPEHKAGTVKTASTGVFALIDALKTRVSTAEGKITALQTTVGDSTSGLVKDVADNATAIGQLETTVGDANSGLVKDVDDLQTTVGDTNSGLVKDVDDLQTTVGDTNSGLVKDVDDLQTTVGDANGGLVKDVADINSKIEQNELTTATALNELNTRVNALEQFDPWENYVAPTNSEP
jgi:hypothetical protein